MSVTYRAVTGFGFKTDILRVDMKDPRYEEFREVIWGALPEYARTSLGNPEYFFEEDFDHEALRDAIENLFPGLVVQWRGNPYSTDRSGDTLMILVKSTFVRTDGAVDMAGMHLVSAIDLKALTRAHRLLEGVNEPSWHLWLEVG